MDTYSDPVLWAIPEWHPDYGDAKAELEHLRHLANVVIQEMPQLSVGLSVPEDGIMFLQIATENEGVLAEIYSHQSDGGADQRKYGIFLFPNNPAEEEHYTPSTRDVIDILSQPRPYDKKQTN